MAGTNGTLRKSSQINQITSFTLLLVVGIFFIIIIPFASTQSPNATMTHSSHHRHRPSNISDPGGKTHSKISLSNHTSYTTNNSMMMNVPIGLECDQDIQCANSSICQDKEYEDHLVVKVCQCDSMHMNRLGQACFVKPGHQCYFPDYQHKTLNCMPETECRSGLNRTLPIAGYCFCKDTRDDEPFRRFNTNTEIRRCDASEIFSLSQGILAVFWSVFVSLV